MEHVYKEMLRNLLRKKYRNIKEKDFPTPNEQGKVELILELYDYLGLGDIEEEVLSPDQIMVKLYKRDH